MNNCQALWSRHLEKTRRDVDEAVEMLKCLAQLGALTAGFAVSAFYDFQYTASSDNPVLPFFGVATALTVRLYNTTDAVHPEPEQPTRPTLAISKSF